ncbi:allophanate hydrolase [Paenarthrobacter aurescens]|uniref:Allophanate hydrolase n=1 Tax=Paenarthrobacter aurescens TaxID=43663 RepID=A0A4Y3NB30_PAEAU|nr:allophanate hydrolase [Paenarthrobacter aurescens]MDO6141882.1 allophanate hydrolase [Paenarthrobacter aurescens]MDO6145687.1 allophanate hydrolase [Paenarthrobacter aurescens]MDO6156931.1 allophanate hydrolase [Paenarthrobacter aurescens]MDO6160917.1 allophanate hydrolase [Paenarthrobacter aurescens]GEB19090.1 allophanate hydrolase [Paenarthrobacter aurescens]
MTTSRGTTAERVLAALEAIDAVDRPEIWIHLRGRDELLAEAARIDAAAAAGEDLPLAGLLLAVKNNVHVAGLITTAACPGFGEAPAGDAVPVARLRAAGALVLGATNLDQFATGLVGTRSPYGAVRDSRRPDRISGGSSSGSAVAVALGLVDIAIGTDTAGSGRIPAALQGIVGIKPTLGVVSTEGVVPACRSWDTATIFARHLATAELAMGIMAGKGLAWPADVKLAAPPSPRVAYPAALPALPEAWVLEFEAQIERLRSTGVVAEPIELDVFLEAARLLYDGGLVAERYAAVGSFIDSVASEGVAATLDPTVAGIISAAGKVPAHRYVTDTATLEQLRTEAMQRLEGFDALVVPTAPFHPTLAEVAADPVGVNSRMGTYTNFCNLFDLSAVAVPAGTVTDEGGVSQFGLTVIAGAFEDGVAADIAGRIELTPEKPGLFAAGAAAPRSAAPVVPWPVAAGAAVVPLVVVGAHRKGQPLAAELERRGAFWDGRVVTAARYRMVALETTPPKPGVVRSDQGTALVAERWLLSEAGLGSFLAGLPEPMLLGSITLDDGSTAVGFACDSVAAEGARDISEYGDWIKYLEENAAAPGIQGLWQETRNALLTGLSRGQR